MNIDMYCPQCRRLVQVRRQELRDAGANRHYWIWWLACGHAYYIYGYFRVWEWD